MSQTSFDDDDLFGEAADEMRSDVEESLEAAWAALPDPDDVWEVEADNVLGALNALRSALDVEEAREQFRDAKKWYTIGSRAEAFDEADDLAEEIERLGDVMDDVESAREQVGDLTGVVPDLRNALEEADADEDESE